MHEQERESASAGKFGEAAEALGERYIERPRHADRGERAQEDRQKAAGIAQDAFADRRNRQIGRNNVGRNATSHSATKISVSEVDHGSDDCDADARTQSSAMPARAIEPTRTVKELARRGVSLCSRPCRLARPIRRPVKRGFGRALHQPGGRLALYQIDQDAHRRRQPRPPRGRSPHRADNRRL